jgi:hypothetical protein
MISKNYNKLVNLFIPLEYKGFTNRDYYYNKGQQATLSHILILQYLMQS